MTGWYVYALTDAAAPAFRSRRRHVEFVKVGDFYAAIARSDERPNLSEAALRDQHAIVSAVASRADAVLPARFGAFVDKDELTAIVNGRSDVIAEAFELVRGREQMTVRVVGSREAVPAHATPARSGTEYLRQRREAVAVACPEIVSAIEAAVHGMSAASRVEAGRGTVWATVYHLIERGGSKRYREALQTIPRTALADVRLVVSGPWPPFAFAPEL